MEHVVTSLLQAYRRRLRAIVASAPAWVCEQILSASELIGDDRAVLWMSENQAVTDLLSLVPGTLG